MVRACFEVGPHYEWLYDLLMEYCLEVEVVNPADFVLISRSQRKTDKIDAQKLAEGLHRGDLPSIYVPDKAVRADRRLVSFVHKLSQNVSTIKGRIRSLLSPQRLICPYRDVLGRQGRKWLETEALPQLGDQERVLLEMLVAQADLLLAQRAELDRRVDERAGVYDCADYLRSIPGFGPLTTLALASATGDVSRFSTPGQLSSYFGVCGSIHQSGRSVWRGGLTKRGNRHVRWLLSQSLQHLHRKDPKAAKRYKRLKRGKPTGVARGAQMRWLTEIVWRLMTYGEFYRIKPLARAGA
jgi:transposase